MQNDIRLLYSGHDELTLTIISCVEVVFKKKMHQLSSYYRVGFSFLFFFLPVVTLDA